MMFEDASSLRGNIAQLREDVSERVKEAVIKEVREDKERLIGDVHCRSKN
jgi:hypothetical protein